jgi:hypothetical protein
MTRKIKNNLPHLKMLKENNYLGLPINATELNPVHQSIVEKAYREITLLMARYSRVVLVRVDLYPPTRDIQQIEIKEFCKVIKRKLDKEYKTKVAYQWAKEFGKKGNITKIHWHLWFAIKNDGNTQPHTQAKKMQNKIIDTWEELVGKNERNHMSGWFYLDRNKFSVAQRREEQNKIIEGGDEVLINMKAIMKRDNNKGIALGGVIDECFYAISYLAKIFSKVKIDSTIGSRVTACSNLNTSDDRKNRNEEIEQKLAKIHFQLEQPPLEPKTINTDV